VFGYAEVDIIDAAVLCDAALAAIALMKHCLPKKRKHCGGLVGMRLSIGPK